jgi:hypothetical protein
VISIVDRITAAKKIGKTTMKHGGNVQHVDYIFLQPGHPSSGMQSLHSEVVRNHFTQKGKVVCVSPATGSDVFGVRNACLMRRGYAKDQLPFQGQVIYDRLIWIDSDQFVTVDQIERLIAWDVDIVAGWARQYSSGSVDDNNRGACGKWDLEPRIPGKTPGKNIFRPYTVGDLRGMPDGLLEVDYCGMSLMVVKYGVFETLEYPWFTSWQYEWEDERGNVCADMMMEDTGFCLRVREKGFKLHIDPAVKVGHEKKVIV